MSNYELSALEQYNKLKIKKKCFSFFGKLMVLTGLLMLSVPNLKNLDIFSNFNANEKIILLPHVDHGKDGLVKIGGNQINWNHLSIDLSELGISKEITNNIPKFGNNCYLVDCFERDGLMKDEFRAVYTELNSWLSGSLGTCLALVALVIGLASSLVHASPLPALMGIMMASMVTYAPQVFEAIIGGSVASNVKAELMVVDNDLTPFVASQYFLYKGDLNYLKELAPLIKLNSLVEYVEFSSEIERVLYDIDISVYGKANSEMSLNYSSRVSDGLIHDSKLYIEMENKGSLALLCGFIFFLLSYALNDKIRLIKESRGLVA